MKELELLIAKRWILKKDDPQLYYQIKDHALEIRSKVQEKLGYSLIVNPYLIKLEKIPGYAEPWMGIQDFQSVLEYRMLCYVFMFLEDKEVEFQFVLSSLAEYVQVQFEEGEVDWTKRSIRKSFLKVLRFIVKNGILIQVDGDDEAFIENEKSEVLYENTGVSRYFMRNFTTDIMQYSKSEDFMNSGWLGMDQDRGIIRRQRVYRRLLLSCGAYKLNDKDDEDFNYIRNYRSYIEKDFQSMFACDLQVHSSSAYLNIAEECSIGKVFPAKNAKDDLMLLMHHEIRQRIKKYLWKTDDKEQVILPIEEFQKVIKKMLTKQIEKMPKTYQAMGVDGLLQVLINQAEVYGFVKQIDDTIIIYPIAGKMIGDYQGG